jgi:retron-type reverse transcriptase
MKAIVSARDLASQLGYSLARLREVAAAGNANYRVKIKQDKKGKPRRFEVPNRELMEIQRRIVRLLSRYPVSPIAHGAVKGRSARTNAEEHLGKPLLVTVDIRKCFPSAKHTEIFAMFRRDFGFGDAVASLLTRLTTFKGHLPQGGATSPALANSLLTELVDRPLIALAKEHGVVYSRYIDDFAFSGDDPRSMIHEAAKRLSALGLRIYRKKKLKIARNDSVQKVTGLVVNSRKGASVGRPYVAKLRSSIHKFPQFPKVSQAQAADSIRGRIAYVRLFNKGAAARLQQQFQGAAATLA